MCLFLLLFFITEYSLCCFFLCFYFGGSQRELGCFYRWKSCYLRTVCVNTETVCSQSSLFLDCIYFTPWWSEHLCGTFSPQQPAEKLHKSAGNVCLFLTLLLIFILLLPSDWSSVQVELCQVWVKLCSRSLRPGKLWTSASDTPSSSLCRSCTTRSWRRSGWETLNTELIWGWSSRRVVCFRNTQK